MPKRVSMMEASGGNTAAGTHHDQSTATSESYTPLNQSCHGKMMRCLSIAPGICFKVPMETTQGGSLSASLIKSERQGSINTDSQHEPFSAPSLPLSLVEFFKSFGLRPGTVESLTSVGFTPSTLVAMKDDEIEQAIGVLSGPPVQVELMLGEKFGIKMACRAWRGKTMNDSAWRGGKGHGVGGEEQYRILEAKQGEGKEERMEESGHYIEKEDKHVDYRSDDAKGGQRGGDFTASEGQSGDRTDDCGDVTAEDDGHRIEMGARAERLRSAQSPLTASPVNRERLPDPALDSSKAVNVELEHSFFGPSSDMAARADWVKTISKTAAGSPQDSISRRVSRSKTSAICLLEDETGGVSTAPTAECRETRDFQGIGELRGTGEFRGTGEHREAVLSPSYVEARPSKGTAYGSELGSDSGKRVEPSEVGEPFGDESKLLPSISGQHLQSFPIRAVASLPKAERQELRIEDTEPIQSTDKIASTSLRTIPSLTYPLFPSFSREQPDFCLQSPETSPPPLSPPLPARRRPSPFRSDDNARQALSGKIPFHDAHQGLRTSAQRYRGPSTLRSGGSKFKSQQGFLAPSRSSLGSSSLDVGQPVVKSDPWTHSFVAAVIESGAVNGGEDEGVGERERGVGEDGGGGGEEQGGRGEKEQGLERPDTSGIQPPLLLPTLQPFMSTASTLTSCTSRASAQGSISNLHDFPFSSPLEASRSLSLPAFHSHRLPTTSPSGGPLASCSRHLSSPMHASDLGQSPPARSESARSLQLSLDAPDAQQRKRTKVEVPENDDWEERVCKRAIASMASAGAMPRSSASDDAEDAMPPVGRSDSLAARDEGGTDRGVSAMSTKPSDAEANDAVHHRRDSETCVSFRRPSVIDVDSMALEESTWSDTKEASGPGAFAISQERDTRRLLHDGRIALVTPSRPPLSRLAGVSDALGQHHPPQPLDLTSMGRFDTWQMREQEQESRGLLGRSVKEETMCHVRNASGRYGEDTRRVSREGSAAAADIKDVKESAGSGRVTSEIPPNMTSITAQQGFSGGGDITVQGQGGETEQVKEEEMRYESVRKTEREGLARSGGSLPSNFPPQMQRKGRGRKRIPETVEGGAPVDPKLLRRREQGRQRQARYAEKKRSAISSGAGVLSPTSSRPRSALYEASLDGGLGSASSLLSAPSSLASASVSSYVAEQQKGSGRDCRAAQMRSGRPSYSSTGPKGESATRGSGIERQEGVQSREMRPSLLNLEPHMGEASLFPGSRSAFMAAREGDRLPGNVYWEAHCAEDSPESSFGGRLFERKNRSSSLKLPPSESASFIPRVDSVVDLALSLPGAGSCHYPQSPHMHQQPAGTPLLTPSALPSPSSIPESRALSGMPELPFFYSGGHNPEGESDSRIDAAHLTQQSIFSAAAAAAALAAAAEATAGTTAEGRQEGAPWRTLLYGAAGLREQEQRGFPYGAAPEEQGMAESASNRASMARGGLGGETGPQMELSNEDRYIPASFPWSDVGATDWQALQQQHYLQQQQQLHFQRQQLQEQHQYSSQQAQQQQLLQNLQQQYLRERHQRRQQEEQQGLQQQQQHYASHLVGREGPSEWGSARGRTNIRSHPDEEGEKGKERKGDWAAFLALSSLSQQRTSLSTEEC
eukprot:TRINITY_DN123_c1_g2_i3.p1 TRINITY_DN123_c1_g2~~TRINITY_DN123_c1_g2_i3.p1  ORF type:complete len:1627 (+),score=324.38 TRINITY_DN123_c1_g2_i3:550-5430(+)